jgi:large subunit ribosomal protein L13
MKTYVESKERAEQERKWVLFDADNQNVGRLASEIARVLRGKDNPRYTPHTDCGDFVVVINADKVHFTGDKEDRKIYYHHTGFIGGIKDETAKKLRARKPEEIIKRAVQGMLPKNPLGRKQLGKLKVYAGNTHPHAAQKVEPF